LKRIALAIISILMLATLVFGADVPITFLWDRNTEADMKEYKLYRTDGSRINLATIQHPASGTTVTHTQVVSIPDVGEGTLLFVVTALDTSGNESGDSNIVAYPFDKRAPVAPGNFRKQ